MDGLVLSIDDRRRVLGRCGRARVLEVAALVRGGPCGGDESVLSVLDDLRVLHALEVSTPRPNGGASPGEDGAGFARWLAGGVGRGGGGGTERPEPARRANARVFLCAWPPASEPQVHELTVPTIDPCDRAHDVHDSRGLLVNAAVLNGQARARRYPVCQVNVRGVAVDSQFDELYERQRRLDRELGGVDGVSYACGGRENAGSTSAAAHQAAVKRVGDRQFHAITRRNARSRGL